MGELLLVRHGETEWSRTGQLGGRTDLPMTDAGEIAARALAPVLSRHRLVAAFTSPISRAIRTTELAGLTGVRPDPDLLEWDYGACEGRTEEQIRQERPGWDLWQDGVRVSGADRGETLAQVAARADAVLGRVRPLLAAGDVALIGHGHLQRVIAARWLGLDPAAARLIRHPHPGSLSALGHDRGQPVISSWNIRPVRRRDSARVLLVNSADEVLLFRFLRQPGKPELGTLWITPGGGIQPGEPAAAAAARELREETGLAVPAAELGSAVAVTSGPASELAWLADEFRDEFFFLRVDHHDVDISGFEALEASTFAGHRWWSPADLAAATELIAPLGLAGLLADLLAGRRRLPGPPPLAPLITAGLTGSSRAASG